MNLSQEEKIQVCLDLAEALYILHGYSSEYNAYEVNEFVRLTIWHDVMGILRMIAVPF